MKLCVNSMGSPDWTLERLVSTAAELGYQAIEIRSLRGEKDFRKMPEFSAQGRTETRDLLKQHGIELLSLNTSAAFHDETIYGPSVEEAKAAIDLAAEMGVPYIRVFGDRIPSPEQYESTLDLAAKGLSEVSEYAKGTGVVPVLETHWNFNSLSVFRDLFSRFDEVPFGVLWDIEHTHKAHGRNIIEFLGCIAPYLKYVHVKDAYYDPEIKRWRCCLLGQGELPIPMIVQMLAAINYDGYLSFEWEKLFQPDIPDCAVAYPAYVNYMKKILYYC